MPKTFSTGVGIMRGSSKSRLLDFFDSIFVPYTCFVCALALLFGGGTRQGELTDAVVEIASLPLATIALIRLATIRLPHSSRWGLLLLAGTLLIPVLQLIPLPSSIWALSADRSGFLAELNKAQIHVTWLPFSLAPNATWFSFLSLIPAAALFCAVLSMSGRERRPLIVILLAVVCISVVLDLFQMSGGPESPLRFYSFTNTDRAVGFFANSNHNAAFLFAAVPFALLWLNDFSRRDRYSGIRLLYAAVLVLAIIVALVATRSRAGLGLAVLAGLACYFLIVMDQPAPDRRRFAVYGALVFVVGLVILFQVGFITYAQRFEGGLSEDLRWPVFQLTLKAAVAHLPFGSGLGSFQPMYEIVAPRSLVTPEFMNHAHNDWIELLLETGIEGLILMAGFLVWYGAAIARTWRLRLMNACSYRNAAPAAMLIPLLLFHSAFDYPLRTITMMSILALACGLLSAVDSRSRSFAQNEHP